MNLWSKTTNMELQQAQKKTPLILKGFFG